MAVVVKLPAMPVGSQLLLTELSLPLRSAMTAAETAFPLLPPAPYDYSPYLITWITKGSRQYTVLEQKVTSFGWSRSLFLSCHALIGENYLE